MYTPPTITGYYINGEFYKPEMTRVVEGRRVPVTGQPKRLSLTRKQVQREAGRVKRRITGRRADGLKAYIKRYFKTIGLDRIFVAKVRQVKGMYVMIHGKGKRRKRVFVSDIPEALRRVVEHRRAWYERPLAEASA